MILALHAALGRLRPAVRILAVMLCAAVPAWSVSAQDLPQQFNASATKARKQYCSTRFTIDADGHWRAHTTFTNRRRLGSDRFEAVFRLVDVYGDITVAIKHSARVHGRLALRRSNRASVTSSGYLDPALVPFENVSVSYRCTGAGGVSDDDLVGRLIRIITIH